MSDEEWEALCDGCGRCCLNKLEDWDTGEIAFTAVACTLLDEWTCRCTDYDKRHEKVPDCVKLTPDTVGKLGWLPDTCAYRVVAEGRPLAWWHPLVSGDAETVHDAGISVMGRVVSEDHVAVEEYEDFIVSWPG
ncbi:MAG: YcgN family cysteine cluster protein, partial [Pseudomonadota bacterium]